MKTRTERLEEWMREEFRKTGCADEHYPVFAEIFTSEFNGERIDALDFPDQLADANLPEFGSVRHCVEERTLELFRHYLKCLDDGHSAKFARVFARKVDEHVDDLKRASRDAFDAIRTGWECGMTNGAFVEAHAVCLHQGRSALYAEKCAKYLIDDDLCFSRAQAKAGVYEETFARCIAKGYPEVRAKAFAEYWVRTDVSRDRSFAEAFARVYEEQIAAGSSHTKAWVYADTFMPYYQRFCGADWDESESVGTNNLARLHTIGDLRARGKKFERFDYPNAFAMQCNITPKRDDQSTTEWLDEVESRTDILIKGRMLGRANRYGRGCDHGTVYLDLETQRTALEVGGWGKLEQLGVSIAVAITSDGPQVFSEIDIPKLAKLLAHAKRIVGHNLRSFDLRVLGGYAGFSIGSARVVDLMDEVEQASGHHVALQSLASATLGINLSHSSLDMVKCWKEGNVLDIIEGCSNDVFAIQALHKYARENGELFYFPHDSQQRERVAVASF